MPVVVGINGFSFDTENEKDLLQKKSKEYGVPIISSTHWADGGAGAAELAETIGVKCTEESENNFQFLYPDEMPLWDKMDTIAKKIYGASGISANAIVRAKIDELLKQWLWSLSCLRCKDSIFFFDKSITKRSAI